MRGRRHRPNRVRTLQISTQQTILMTNITANFSQTVFDGSSMVTGIPVLAGVAPGSPHLFKRWKMHRLVIMTDWLQTAGGAAGIGGLVGEAWFIDSQNAAGNISHTTSWILTADEGVPNQDARAIPDRILMRRQMFLQNVAGETASSHFGWRQEYDVRVKRLFNQTDALVWQVETFGLAATGGTFTVNTLAILAYEIFT